MSTRQCLSAVGFAAFLALIIGRLPAKAVDHSILDNVLKANVDKDGYVDYAGIRINKGGDLYEYLTLLETVDVKALLEQERLVFWINAYNAHVIKFILANPKLESIDQAKDMFDTKFKIARYNLSLNDIEHRILRSDPEKGGGVSFSIHNFDPRIHFALVCGAVGCPKIWNRAYQVISLEERLQQNAEAFMIDPKNVRLENGQLIVNALFKWYAKDFEKVGGVVAFMCGLLDPQKRADAEEVKAKIQTDFPDHTDFRYDWLVNNIKNKKL
jgi:hypothetical protein